MGYHKSRRRPKKSPVRKVKPKNKAVLGYCWSPEHRGYLTKKAIDQHGCLEKNCNRFEKRNDKYWNERKIANIRKKCRLYYRKHMELYSKYKNIDMFLSALGSYYNGLDNVPYIDYSGIDISDFIESIRE